MKACENQNQRRRPIHSILSNALLLIIGEAIEFANACNGAKDTVPFETVEKCITNISCNLMAPSSMESMKLETSQPLPTFQSDKTKSPIASQETKLAQHIEREQVTNIPNPVRTEVTKTLDDNQLTGVHVETNQVQEQNYIFY